ncbi:MAG: WYL domain-containing protein [Bacteroidia bacterium]|nr:WYL domain-containing protein [Bacteroidia bacterium]MDW8159459.1 WYL domain-containing protein [Bacteroidia bacterium]
MSEKLENLVGYKVSERQLGEDIRFIWSELFKANNEHEVFEANLRKGNRKAFRYLDTQRSCIPHLIYTPKTIDTLRSAFETLQLLEGIPQFEWLRDSLINLEGSINSLTTKEPPIVELEHVSYADPDYAKKLHQFFDFIRQRRVVVVEYQNYGGELQVITFHPYFLKQYNGRWFVFGYNEEEDKEDWNLSVDDRIKSIKESTKEYRPCGIDWKEYFEDIIGVTKYRNKEAEEIILHFFDRTANYIKSKPIHGSQKDKWLGNGTLEVKIKAIPNYELERLILGYGKFVKVIAPEHLKNAIAEQHKAAYELYLS